MLSRFADYMNLKTQDINNNRDNSAQLIKNIEEFRAAILSAPLSGLISRLFNELHGSYPELEVQLEGAVDLVQSLDLVEEIDLESIAENLVKLKEAQNSENVLSWHKSLLAFAITELFDSDGNLLPTIVEKLNYDGFMKRLMDNRTLKETELINGQFLAGYMINVVGGVASDKFRSNPNIIVFVRRILEAQHGTQTNKEETQINKAYIQLVLESSSRSLPQELKNNIEATNTVSVNQILHAQPLPKLPVKQSFAETSAGKILIATLTAVIISPILVVAAIAVGITLPVSLPVAIGVTAIIAGITTGLITKMADWVGKKLKSRAKKLHKSETISDNVAQPSENSVEISSSYANIGQSFDKQQYNDLYEFLSEKLKITTLKDDSDKNLISLLKDVKGQVLADLYEEMLTSSDNQSSLSSDSFKEKMFEIINNNSDTLSHLRSFHDATKVLDGVHRSKSEIASSKEPLQLKSTLFAKSKLQNKDTSDSLTNTKKLKI